MFRLRFALLGIKHSRDRAMHSTPNATYIKERGITYDAPMSSAPAVR